MAAVNNYNNQLNDQPNDQLNDQPNDQPDDQPNNQQYNMQHVDPFIYISPDNVQRNIPHYTREYFTQLCIEQRVIQNENMDYELFMQIYIRYLCCAGLLNTLFQTLEEVRNHYQNNQQFRQFLNIQNVIQLNNEPFIYTFVRWNNNANSFHRLLQLGCHFNDISVTNLVSHTRWTNPLINILYLPGFPHQINFDIFDPNRNRNNNIINWGVEHDIDLLNINNNHNIIMRRHPAHYIDLLIVERRRNNLLYNLQNDELQHMRDHLHNALVFNP